MKIIILVLLILTTLPNLIQLYPTPEIHKTGIGMPMHEIIRSDTTILLVTQINAPDIGIRAAMKETILHLCLLLVEEM